MILIITGEHIKTMEPFCPSYINNISKAPETLYCQLYLMITDPFPWDAVYQLEIASASLKRALIYLYQKSAHHLGIK